MGMASEPNVLSGANSLGVGMPRAAPLPSGRSPLKPEFPNGMPPLPEINSHQMRLQVFTHRSFFARPTHVFEDMPDDPSPDNEMLEHLGDTVLSLVVTGLMRDVFPCLRVGPSTKIRALVVGNPTLAMISVQYRLPERLRMHPAQAITLRASTNIQADLFESFVGGVYLDGGLEVCKQWLNLLLRPYICEAYRIVRVQHGLSPDPDPPYPALTLAYNPGEGTPTPPGDSTEPPRLPAPTWSIPPPPRIPGNVGHLSLFNQHLQQQFKSIEWVYSDSAGEGTKTTPIWVVRAMVDGKCLGRGRGSTKKAARNEAAKEGLVALGIYVSKERRKAFILLEPSQLVSRLALDVHSRRSWSSRTGVKTFCEGLLRRPFVPRVRTDMFLLSRRWRSVYDMLFAVRCRHAR
ncbi:ribonuclease III domain-containing protein [Daedaleopsis nitida]|nr:ribonuclease III domain-containing protein [Daedaleopsis nitida]